jgi:uncharacterized protein YceK
VKFNRNILIVIAIAIAACILLVIYGCQTVTVQVGPDNSADRATGMRTDTSVTRKEEKKP